MLCVLSTAKQNGRPRLGFEFTVRSSRPFSGIVCRIPKWESGEACVERLLRGRGGRRRTRSAGLELRHRTLSERGELRVVRTWTPVIWMVLRSGQRDASPNRSFPHAADLLKLVVEAEAKDR